MIIRTFRPDDADAVRDLATRAESADGVAPLNEASLLALARAEKSENSTEPSSITVAEEAGRIVGVAVDAEGDGTGVDLVVAPDARRRGIGRRLIAAVRESHPEAGFWAHGNLPEARALAAADGFALVRDLWRMARPTAESETFDTALPEGFVARPFDGSTAQAQAWLDVNAAAFVHHPEQGRMTMADFHDREAEPWFDPAGLILVWDESGPEPVLAASHWTKREPGSDVGEVYVVAVAPAYQGRGLARPLTALGLEHLTRSGAREIDLYVEGDNEPAKATYARSGFTRASQDSMYARRTFAAVPSA